jgi:hypothetical protein
MPPRTRAVGLLAAGAALAIILAWRATRPAADAGGTGPLGDDGAPRTRAAGDGSLGMGVTSYDGGRLERTLVDRRVRDELRRRILAGWAAGEGQVAEAAQQGHFEPMPPGPNGEYVDPAYIQEVIRSEMIPMARACFEELLTRQPDAGGSVEMFFKIVGDEKIGGIVDEVDLDAGAPTAIRDETMNTCIRESLTSLAFRPPPGRGVLTIGYPLIFSADGPDD